MTGAPPRWVVRKFGSNVSNRCEADFEALPAMLGCEDSLCASLVMQKELTTATG